MDIGEGVKGEGRGQEGNTVLWSGMRDTATRLCHYSIYYPTRTHVRTHTHTHTHIAGYPHLALEYFDFFRAFLPLDMDHYGNIEIVFELLATEGQLVEALQVCRSYECSEVEDKYYEALLLACRNSEWQGPHCIHAWD